MAKKKEQRASITKPKVGNWYTFTFAGGSLTGILDCKNDKLTALYGHAWYWMRVPAEYSFAGVGRQSQDIRYPVSIYNLIKEHVQ